MRTGYQSSDSLKKKKMLLQAPVLISCLLLSISFLMNNAKHTDLYKCQHYLMLELGISSLDLKAEGGKFLKM